MKARTAPKGVEITRLENLARRSMDVDCAAEDLAKAIRGILLIDDGDEPLAWKYNNRFEEARRALDKWDEATS